MEEKMFYDREHWQAFTDCISRMRHSDVHHISVAYLLTLDSVCRQHIDECFNFDDDGIIPDAIVQGWQTTISKKTTRLAFNLWNGYCFDGEPSINQEGCIPDMPSHYYAVDEIFACSLAPYYWEAIKLRYPEYADK